jgi:hypothetical protein
VSLRQNFSFTLLHILNSITLCETKILYKSTMWVSMTQRRGPWRLHRRGRWRYERL